MNKLYRIKPLEWERSDYAWSWAREYIVEPAPQYGSMWRWLYSPNDGEEEGGFSKDESEAKAACEEHRRKLLEAELELPTYPGKEAEDA